MLRSFTEGILRTRKEKPERDTLCISEDFSAARAQKHPVKPHGFLSQAAFRRGLFFTIDKSDKIGISPNIFDEFNKLES